MKQVLLSLLVCLGLVACSSTGSGSSSQVYGEVSGGVGYTTSK